MMRVLLGIVLIFLAPLFVGVAPPPAADVVDLRRLLAELDDLHGLTLLPEPRFELVSLSHSPSKTGTAGPTPTVLIDLPGPGALVRLWSPGPSAAGEVQMEVDHELVLTAPLAELLAGAWQPAGFTLPPVPPPLAETKGGSGVWLLPVPFAQRLRILASRPEVELHAECRRYALGTRVQPFSLMQLREGQARIIELARRLSLGIPRSPPPTVRHRRSGGSRLAPGERWVLVDWNGAGAIEHLHLHLGSGPPWPVVLRGRFDDAERPQLLCPLLEFFGSGPTGQPRAALTSCWRADGSGTSRWVMPFARGCRLELVNLGPEPIEARFELVVAERPWTERSLHFHARWQQHWPLPARPPSWLTLCDLQGTGIVVGQQWNLLNPTATWWGEGRDRLTLDEQNPREGAGAASWFGILLDDQTRLDGLWLGQERETEVGHLGWTRLHRIMTVDRIPFRRRLRWEVELRPWDARGNLALGVTSFWYARPGGRDGFPALAAEALRQPPRLPERGAP